MTHRSQRELTIPSPLPKRACATALLAGALLTIPAGGEPLAALRSARGPLVMHDHARVTLRNAGVAVRGYRFVRQARIMQKTPFVDGGPSLEVDVVNEGAQSEDFAIAVALFDREGRLVGVGTGDHTGKLEAGETTQVKVVFRDVNQDAIHATTVQMSLELKR